MYKNSFGPTPKFDLSENYSSTRSDFIVIGGPCSIEHKDQAEMIFDSIHSDCTYFRGGVFRAGTYPSAKWGWQMDLLKIYHELSVKHGKPNIVDVLDIRDLDEIYEYADVFQVGMRQAQHYALLKELGKQRKPVILKRGSWQKLSEFLGSAEYVLQGGNGNLILCERGGVSFLDHTRWELSISMIAAIKKITKLPVIVDASHGTGNRKLVADMTFAGVAAGADGCLLETHYSPDNSMSDSEQAIDIAEFKRIVAVAKQIRGIVQCEKSE